MSDELVAPSVAALRRAFDERFAAPPEAPARATERLLVVDLGGIPFALRAGETAGVHEGARIVRVPGGSSFFLGLAGIRERVVPVFDLAAILGLAGAPSPRRWIVLAAGRERVGLSVAGIEGHADVARDAIHAEGEARAARTPEAREVAEIEGALVPVASVPAVLRAIAERARAAPWSPDREGGDRAERARGGGDL